MECAKQCAPLTDNPQGTSTVGFHYTALLDAVEGADALITATVQAPVTNLAAVPYIERLGGTRIGRIDEVYPDFGPLLSDLWLVRSEAVHARHACPHGLAEAWVRDAAVRALRA